ncbi:hypothetical protein Pint_32053 [Pistacia integerrima]|uniref:Uncharacterized protein n=1 Tax=Pistacia integerrima TaxID=434235 RepID=A0ACC0XNV8_9ROSI|nr:hypothetical protein Pint_32053 [Pistacia integerrima]
MEGRMKKYRQVSPERAKVWTEKSPKYHQLSRKVAVVYYLCRNRQLEHPHFIEVPLSSPDGLYLRDVIDRLNVLRGRGMASMYSWSCKRSYKNGFVWHDLCEDDLILPAHGNEYVLKGSELFDESNSGRLSPVGNTKIQNLKQLSLPEPASSRSQDDSSSSSSMNGKGIKHSQDDDLSPPVQRPGSSGVSPESTIGKNSSWGGSLSLTEYKVYKTDGSADASTQTEGNVNKPKTRETCTRGVSTDDRSIESACNGNYQNQAPCVKENSEICGHSVSVSVSPPPSSCSASSSVSGFLKGRNPNANQRKTQGYKYVDAIDLLRVDIELDCLSENPRLMGLRLEDKEYFSGSLIETKMIKEEGDERNALKRSSSYNADRFLSQSALLRIRRLQSSWNSVEDKEESNSGHSKCIPRSIKASLGKQPRSDSMKSPVCDKPRNSSDRVDSSQSIPSTSSNCCSKRITESVSGKKPSNRLDSFREEKEKVIKIEES